MADAQISKWGNSLAVRLPRDVVRDAKLSEGDHVSLEVTNEQGVLVRPRRRKYALEDLVADITPKNRHCEADFGGPVGKELW